MPGQDNKSQPKKATHALIFFGIAFNFDFVTQSLWYCFNKTLQCRNVYFHTAALTFHQDLALMIIESHHCAKPSPVHPIDSHPCVRMMSNAPRTTLSLFEPDKSLVLTSWNMPCHQERKKQLME